MGTTALLVLLPLLTAPGPVDDRLAALPPGFLLDLDSLAVNEAAAIKLRHLAERPAYPVVLLGNSRSLPVAAPDLDLADGAFFNLSLTGQSFRASVELLETLASMGKLPRLALVQFDNAELQLYAVPAYPPVGDRMARLKDDLAFGLTVPAVSPGDVTRTLWRGVMTEWQAFVASFSAIRVWRGLRVWLARHTGGGEDAFAPVTSRHGYRPDGSRSNAAARPVALPDKVPSTGRNVLPAYLDHDLQRLSRITAAGTKVVVFETVLHPSLHGAAMAAPSAMAMETRAALAAGCARWGLDCRPVPHAFADSAEEWADYSHPPQALLRTLIKPLAAEGGR